MEREFHQWLQRHSLTAGSIPESIQPRFPLIGIGDDGAVIDFENRPLVIATDTIAQGTHFLLSDQVSSEHLELIGRKALAVSLSDIAAMGARPVAATLNFQCPQWFGLDEVQALFIGSKRLADQFNLSIVGGDTNRWSGGLVVTSTVMGTRPPDRRGWSISDAQIDDVILVSGRLGGSIHGRHLKFEPRLLLAQYLAENYRLHAATDISDSLSVDLNAIAAASGVHCQIDLSAIPISKDVRQDSTDPVQSALTDGEDFELVFTTSGDQAARILTDETLPTPVTKIGRVTRGPIGLSDLANEKIQTVGYHH